MKPIQLKPGLYCIFYEHLKQIAESYGYNLVVHGSMQRDLDLIAIPWVDKPQDVVKMLQDFEKYLTGMHTDYEQLKKHLKEHILPGGRSNWTISLNRGDKHGEWVRFEDKEYYLDISITPLNNQL